MTERFFLSETGVCTTCGQPAVTTLRPVFGWRPEKDRRYCLRHARRRMWWWRRWNWVAV